MKKLLVFGIIALSTTACFAYLEENKTATVESLRASGYTESTLEMADKCNYHDKGENSNYVRYYRLKPHKNFLGRAYTYAKKYFDPAQDDGMFLEHEAEFSNTWYGDRTFYSSEQEPANHVENL